MEAATGRRWVAFIRAINGSPHNRVRMADLARMVGDTGCTDVRWYLQTGNLFLRADADPEWLATAIQQRLEAEGMRHAEVMLRTPETVAALVARRPFAGCDPAALQFEVTFLHTPPATSDASELTGEHGAVITHQDPTVVCFAFPRGGRMQGGFNGWIERNWGVAATSRAWNVVEAVATRAAGY